MMIRPLKESFLEKAKKGLRVPVVKELSSDSVTPVDVFYAVQASYLLESAEKGLQLGRYSFLGVEPSARIEIRGSRCVISEGGKDLSFETSDPLRVVMDFVSARQFSGEGDLSPFPGGAVGYLGYETVASFEKVFFSDAKPGLGIPDSVFLVTRYTLVFDNLMHTLKIICNVDVGDDPSADYDEAIRGITAMEERILNADRYRPKEKPVIGKEIHEHSGREKYLEGVSKLREYIAQGEAIQIVLSQRMSIEFKGDPFYVYRQLRSINPSPYMFYLNFGDFVIFGASPEVMVKVDGDKALLRPIAGTRPRGKNQDEDESFKKELLSDQKERAEHIMLVDLARNDLGRIAKPGSVKLTRFMDVEYYSHVMHIVSEVTAELQGDNDAIDVIRAVFPAGTVSGAPKVRAMEIIEETEPERRNHYAGLVGYFSYNGSFDSCIAIRTVACVNDRLYLQAGAGIVYDSVPEKEYEEVLAKSRALVTAIENGRN
jgi:anthranilate synthase component 1